MKTYKNIIVGIDDTESSVDIFNRALEIADKENSNIILVSGLTLMPNADIINSSIEATSLNKKSDFNYDELLGIKERKEHMQQFIDELESRGYKNYKIEITEEHVATYMLRYLDNYEDALIVIGASRKTKLKKIVLGSTAKYLVDKAVCDIFLIKNT